ncbi:MAG: hypothetical protein C0481_03670 [Phenylobacterium sp.]|nr:hypothetical protein [Phenylobacterium sp.]
MARVAASAELGFGAAGDEGVLPNALSDAGFKGAATFSLVGQAERGPLAADGEVGAPTVVRVPVGPTESAVILVEGDDGVFAWAMPQRRLSSSSLGIAEVEGAELVFVLGEAPVGPAISWDVLRANPLLNWLTKRAKGGLKARVLKFTVAKIEDWVIEKVEGDLAPGLLSVEGQDPTKWRVGGQAPRLGAVSGLAAKRVLLLVHGTFSTTEGSFGQLTASQAGRDFLQDLYGRYDAVLGFDHRTLAESPEANAQAMSAALHGVLPKGAEVDAIGYSRGGLVLREWLETLVPAERPDLKLGKAVFVGCTNRGTNLAEPEHWRTLIDLYTNAAIAAGRAVSLLAGRPELTPAISYTLKTIGQFVQYFSTVAITMNHVPGLAAMRPSSPLVTRLNAAKETGPSPLYHAVTSNFVAQFDAEMGVTKELAQMVKDRVTNQLFGGANDLVVDTSSMTFLGSRQARLDTTRTFAFGDGEDVYHTIYFGAEPTARKLGEWLL